MINQSLADTVFTPKPNRAETRADITSRIAREIIDQEVLARDAKTDRLRAARLAREAEEAAVACQTHTSPGKRKGRKVSAS